MLDLKNRTLIHLTSGFHSLAGVRSVRLETSSVCQLKCPVCPTGSGANKDNVIGKGFLPFDNFRRFVDNSPKIRLIELSNFGEIFLNPELLEMFRYAYRKKVHLTAFNGVNLNTVTDNVIEGLVKYKVKGLTLSIDGASDKIYAVYRINGDFKQVIKNIERINYYKNKYKSRWPILRWQFVLFKHNQHELVQAKQMARKMNAIFTSKPNWEDTNSPSKDSTNTSCIKKITHTQKQPLIIYCTQFWYQPQINWDGKLLGCCVNHFKDFGNVFSDGLDSLMASEKYRRTKDILLGKESPDSGSPCAFCPIFTRLQ